MPENFVRARFTDYEAFEHALHQLKDANIPGFEAYGPTNLQEFEEFMPHRPTSMVRPIATLGALIGLITFAAMAIMSSLIYNLITGGKPPWSNVPFFVPAYEGTILLGSIFAFIAFVISAKMWRFRLPSQYDTRFSDDSFGITVRCEPDQCGDIIKMLSDSGAIEVNEAQD